MLDGLGALGLGLREAQLSLLDRFRHAVVRENLVQNLTTLVGDYDMAVKHVLDSLTLLATGLFDGPGRVVDIGSGAGFPGVPLKVARPDLKLTLLDSLRKRAAFLERAVRELGLEGCEVVAARAETFARQEGRRESYDLAVARAVAPLVVDLEYASPLLRVGGRFVAMKGPRLAEELGPALRASATLGVALDRVVELTLPLAGERRALAVFLKLSPTPDAYPRREGVPERRPLATSGR